MQVYIGFHVFNTKLHLIELKQKLPYSFKYIRDDFDHIIVDFKGKEVTITQDGLLYLKTTIQKVSELKKLEKSLYNEFVKELNYLDDESFLFMNVLDQDASFVIITGKKDIDFIFDEYGKQKDYTINSKYFTKSYGGGLAVINNLKKRNLSNSVLKEYIETQILFSETQNLIKSLIEYNRVLWDEISVLRKKENLLFKDLPLIIDNLFEHKRKTSLIISRVETLSFFIDEREHKCKIFKLLDSIKLNDFREMRHLILYVKHQFSMTRSYTTSTIDLVQFLYKENEQKEFNILQVIFAIGTISTIVSLGAMPGAKIFMNIIDNQIVGEVVSFNFITLILWTLISVLVGVIMFIFLNYVFLSAKKLKIVELIKKKKK
jgi:hypothetical protein